MTSHHSFGRGAEVRVALAGGMGKSSVIEFMRSIAQAAGYRVRVEQQRCLPLDHAANRRFADRAGCEADRAVEPELHLIELDTDARCESGERAPDAFGWLPLGLGALPASAAASELPALLQQLPAEKGGTAVVLGPGTLASAEPGSLEAACWIHGRDYQFDGDRQQWRWACAARRLGGLAYPALRGANQLANAALALALLERIGARLPIAAQAVRVGLATAALPGRFQILPGQPSLVLDLAHTPHAAHAACRSLDQMGFHPRTVALLDASTAAGSTIQSILDPVVDDWCLLAEPEQAGALLAAALAAADPADRLLVCGSYAIVGAVMSAGLPRLRAAQLA